MMAAGARFWNHPVIAVIFVGESGTSCSRKPLDGLEAEDIDDRFVR